ncbi:hypothetical protein [Humidesulfovibrio idahonensis]
MNALRKRIAPLLAGSLLTASLLAGCSSQDLSGAAMVSALAVAGVAQVTGVGFVLHAALDPTPLAKLSADKTFAGNAQAQALAAAAEKGDVQAIDSLVDAGADVNAVGLHGLSICEWLLFHPNKDGFRRLLERGADPNRMTVWTGPQMLFMHEFTEQQSSLVHWAVYRTPQLGPDYLRMVLEIGKGDPNLELPDRKARPIMKALGRDNGEAFCLLYNHGAELEFLTADGKTPIETAAWVRDENYRLVYFMLTHGVSFSYAAAVPDFGGLQGAVQRTLDNGNCARQPFDAGSMWFWRCVDFLERRGMVFEYPSRNRGPVLKPVALESTPVNLLAPAQEPFAVSRRVSVLGVALTLPRPYWDRTPGSGAVIACRSDEMGAKNVYLYYPGGDMTDRNAMQLCVQRAPGKALAEFTAEAVKTWQSAPKHVATLVEKAGDHEIYRLSARSSKIGGYFYVGMRNNTAVTLTQVIQKSGRAEVDAADDAYVLNAMRQINLAPAPATPPQE